MWWACVSNGVVALLLLGSQQACIFGTSCSDGRRADGDYGPCSDSSHFTTCQGGEGYEYDVEKACPSATPVCVTRNVSDHQCIARQ